MNRQIAVNDVELRRYKDNFLEKVLDFGDFTVRSGTYWTEEREYKEEVSALCRTLLPRSLFDASGPDNSDDVWEAVRQSLTTKLRTINEPQNIVAWRNVDSLRRYPPEDRRVLAKAMGILLYGQGDAADRIGSFNEGMWPIFDRDEQSNQFARSRIIPTFFLIMIDPQKSIMVRTDLTKRFSSQLVGRQGISKKVFTPDEYRDVLSIAQAVMSKLESWGWCPMDFIDVHSFLWVVSWNDEAGVYGEGKGVQ